MVTAKTSQSAASPAHPRNTTDKPPCWNIQPPMMPPNAEPRNWLVEYTPMAVPLPPAGETLLISEGNEASSRLNAVNTTVPIASAQRLSPESARRIVQ